MQLANFQQEIGLYRSFAPTSEKCKNSSLYSPLGELKKKDIYMDNSFAGLLSKLVKYTQKGFLLPVPSNDLEIQFREWHPSSAGPYII